MGISTDIQRIETSTQRKLDALRAQMQTHQLDAYLIPAVDEHINEYLPKNRERRAWASGFTGSAGDFLLGTEAAWVFVDSRYYEQADYEVATALIQIHKLGLEGHLSPLEQVRVLAEQKPGFRLGLDPFTMTLLQYQAFKKALDTLGGVLVPIQENLADTVWTDQPPTPAETVFKLADSITGLSVAQKLALVRDKMKSSKTDLLPLTKLDQIAWLFNLRGQDIPYNPVFIAYALITSDTAYLFTNTRRIQTDAKQALSEWVQFEPYERYAETLASLTKGKTALIDPKHTTYGTLYLVEQNQGQVKEADQPIEMLKAVKNSAETRGMQEANLRASRGKIRAWYWLDQQCNAGKRITEETFKDAIEGFYAEEDGFFGLSFNTISGAGANSSIVHYGTPDPNKTLEEGELFLIDSGCQFYGADFAGTTDDTRTMLIGKKATASQQLRYTEVLKAHINCAMQKFPKGTEGTRIDGITRSTLWQHGLDYGHGTGHGVGAFLNVHEGPNGIHKLASKAFEPNMVTSIEPGFYEPGWGGIRLENLYRSIDLGNGQYGFESLTYIPFDPKLIDFSRLHAEQLEWLTTYYQLILEKIKPSLSKEEGDWLQTICTIPD